MAIACGVESMTRVADGVATPAAGSGPFSPDFMAACDGQLDDAVRGGADPGRAVQDQPRGHGRVRGRVAPTGPRALVERARSRPSSCRSRSRTRTARDRRDARARRGHPARRRRWRSLAALPSAAKWDPTLAPDITAGNSSQMSDGAAAMLIADRPRRRGSSDCRSRAVFRHMVGGRRRRRAGAVGAEPGHPQAARAHGHDHRRLRRDRVQRGVRRHRAACGPASSCPTVTWRASTRVAAPSPSVIRSARPVCA